MDAGATKDETGSIPCRRAIAVAATWKMALLMIGSFQFLREAGRRQKGREIFFAFFNRRYYSSSYYRRRKKRSPCQNASK